MERVLIYLYEKKRVLDGLYQLGCNVLRDDSDVDLGV